MAKTGLIVESVNPDYVDLPRGAHESIEWAPLASPVAVSFSGGSYRAVHSALTETFGKFPIRLTRDKHLVALHGMHAATLCLAYKQLADGLERFGDIEVRDV